MVAKLAGYLLTSSTIFLSLLTVSTSLFSFYWKQSVIASLVKFSFLAKTSKIESCTFEATVDWY